jgi:hypothetical protein
MPYPKIKLRASEIEILAGHPEALRILAGWHSCAETMADAMDYTESAEGHGRRSEELEKAAKAIHAEDMRLE